MLIAYLNEDQDAAEVAGLVEDARPQMSYSCVVTWPIRLTVER